MREFVSSQHSAISRQHSAISQNLRVRQSPTESAFLSRRNTDFWLTADS